MPAGRVDVDVDRRIRVAVREQKEPRADVTGEPVMDVAEDQDLASPEQLGFNPADKISRGSRLLFRCVVVHGLFLAKKAVE